MKTILITGASRGIGKALAEVYLKNGHKVIGTSIDGSLDFSHPNLSAVQLDLSKPESIKKCVADVVAMGQKIDILHNNAGVLLDDENTSLEIELLRQTLEINIIGTADFTEQILSIISDGGHIINTSSQAGSLEDMVNFEHSHAPYRYPAYKISKTALNMYTSTLALRMKHEGKNITVSSVNPGWVKTAMGGQDADLTPDEAATYIYQLGISKPETGQFWYKGEKFPW